MTRTRGYTLVELIIAVGLFALIMLLSSGAYLMMIGLNRQAQGLATGVDNLSFALETMARSIRTGTHYCTGGCTLSNFSFTNEKGAAVSYSLSGSAIQETVGGVQSALTDPSVTISSLSFLTTGTPPASAGDYEQSRVTIVASGSVSYGKGKTQSFTVETGATMRGSDI